ncbi:MAG: hypothetical protein ACBR50_01190 [Microcoleus sp.]
MNTRNLDDQVEESTEKGAIEVAGKFPDAATRTSANSQTEFNNVLYLPRH